MEASKASQLLAEKLSFYANRSKVIASNIANIDTPGYKTKDVVSFEDSMKTQTNKLNMATTHSGHIQANSKVQSSSFEKINVKNLQEDMTGNNVDLDKQMAEHAKNNLIFQATKSALKKDSQLMKSVIDSAMKMQ